MTKTGYYPKTKTYLLDGQPRTIDELLADPRAAEGLTASGLYVRLSRGWGVLEALTHEAWARRHPTPRTASVAAPAPSTGPLAAILASLGYTVEDLGAHPQGRLLLVRGAA